jgi:hypothetical protein
MKRLVWLLMFAVTTALAQVAPVDTGLVPEEKCPCCEGAGDCGMPECGLPPHSAQPVSDLASSARIARAASKAVASMPRSDREQFYVQFLARPRVAQAMSVHATLAPAASVPLFREHCSLLI